MNDARAVVKSLDAEVAILNVSSLDDLVQQQLGRPRFAARISSIFSFLSLALAALGIYGVLMYVVASRRRELGIRAALGANAALTIGMVLRQALQLVIPGIILGTALGVLTTAALAGFLFGVGRFDAASFGFAAAVLIIAALAASGFPAWRAVRISPMQALRP
jgi:ABC-type antimicrobial peptide transport system permease subunit